MTKVAVVVPSIREHCWNEFKDAWGLLFQKHNCDVVRVIDGEDQRAILEYDEGKRDRSQVFHLANRRLEDDLIVKFSPACRCFGFDLVRTADVILTLDDDCFPIGDPIQDHLDILGKRVSIDWFPTIGERPRGFPVCEWAKAPVMVSHGLWACVPDYDAATQLVGAPDNPIANKQIIYRGVQAPICGMNVAFKREALPYMYWAPCVELDGCQRFDDIWMGLFMKRAMDRLGWAVASGYSIIKHLRASDPKKNIWQEFVGMAINEHLWKEIAEGGDGQKSCISQEQREFFATYAVRRKKWCELFGGDLSIL